MRYKASINDYIYKDYLYSSGALYKINENFETITIYDETMSKTLADSLTSFKKLNAYVTKKNKIFPATLNVYSQPAVRFSKHELAIIKALKKDLTLDQTFIIARDLAFKKDYKKSRLLCDFILNKVPNYCEIHSLKGKILAWEGNFPKAETELLNAIKRTTFEIEAYLALMDVYKWSNQNAKAIKIGQRAIEYGIKNPEIKFKMKQAYKNMQKV